MIVTYGKGFVQPMRKRVDTLEASMLKLPQADCPVRHYFAPGMYAREMSIKAGTVVVGAIHKTEHLIVVSKGRLQIVTDDGTVEIEAPHTMTCKPGQKNAVHVLENAVWTNFFPTTEADPEKLVEILTESTADKLLGGKNNAQLLANAKMMKVEG